MGVITHHAIIVIGSGDRVIPDQYKTSTAHAKALELGIDGVTPLGPIVTNGTQSFVIGPDGSKEGWNTSDEQEALREKFLNWLRKPHHFYWAHVEIDPETATSTLLDHVYNYPEE